MCVHDKGTVHVCQCQPVAARGATRRQPSKLTSIDLCTSAGISTSTAIATTASWFAIEAVKSHYEAIACVVTSKACNHPVSNLGTQPPHTACASVLANWRYDQPPPRGTSPPDDTCSSSPYVSWYR